MRSSRGLGLAVATLAWLCCSGASRLLHDASKVATGTNYPACATLPRLLAEQEEEEKRSYNLVQTYQTWQEAGQLHCGMERVGLGLVDKKHNEQWVEGCVEEILPAKRRLLGFMQELCRDQAEANTRKATGGGGGGGGVAAAKRRGIIYTGKGEHFKDIFQSILGLRLHNVTLPVEIWINGRDETVCKAIFHAPGNGGGECKSLPDSVSGFASKFYALLSTQLNHVMFIDADNMAARDVNLVFDSPQFAKHGAIIWPDLWGDSCRVLSSQGQHNGMTGFQTHVLWMAHFGGLAWASDDRNKVQESEAGQIAYDLDRHAGLLELGRKFIEDRRFLKRVVNGDKDIFRLVHMMMGEPFTYAPHFPGYSVADKPGYGRDCLTQYWDGAGSTSPMFFHQLKNRDPEAFLQAKRVDPSLRNAPSACVDLGRGSGTLPLVVERHADGERLRQWARQLFTDVDSRWEAQGFASLLWYHDWLVFLGGHASSALFALVVAAVAAGIYLRRVAIIAFFKARGAGGAVRRWIV